MAIVLFSVVLLLLSAAPALAIDKPDTMMINHVWVYRNCLETGDQLYMVDFTVDYTANPSQDISETIICRLKNGATELAATTPFPYFDDGYERGVVAFYFNPDEAPAWAGAYTVQLFGNPLLSWAPEVPELSTSTFDLWQDNDIPVTLQVLSSRVLWLAEEISKDWDTTYSLIEYASTGNFLSTEGQEYYGNVIPSFAQVAPYSLADRTIPLDAERREYSQDYAGDLETDITGSVFDLSDLGTAFGMNRGSITALLYYAVVILFMVMIVRQIGDYKPIMLFSVPCVILGAFIGVPLLITVMAGFICLVMTGYALFYSSSGA